MVTTENTYTGDGVTTEYQITFEYVNTSDIQVSLDDVPYPDFSFIDATTIELDVAPALGVVIRVFRSSNLSTLPHTFFPGSAIRAQDLNQDFEQILFVAQEVQRDSDYAFNAVPIAAEARQTADEAKVAALKAEVDANNAVNGAANATISAYDANQTADSAVVTANAATTTASEAKQTADAAAELVASANLPNSINTISEVPTSPSDNDLYEISNSTGIESFSPLSGLPAGFVGDPGLSVRILYQTDTWVYLSYNPTDPDTRYITDSELASTVSGLNADINVAQQEAEAADAKAQTRLPLSGGTMTGPIVFDAGQSFGIGTANGSTAGLVGLSSSVTSTLGDSGGFAATPAGVKTAYDRASSAINTAVTANSTANTATSTADAANAAATSAQSTAGSAQSAATTAQDTADGAQSTASAAQVTANAALKGVPVHTQETDLVAGDSNIFIADIPSTVGVWDKIEVIFRNLNIDQSDSLLVQIYTDSNGLYTEGYQSTSNGNGGTSSAQNGFVIRRGSNTTDISGLMQLDYLTATTTGDGAVVSSHAVGDNSNAYCGGGFTGSFVGVVTKLRIKGSNSNDFVKGKILVRVWKYS